MWISGFQMRAFEIRGDLLKKLQKPGIWLTWLSLSKKFLESRNLEFGDP